MISIIICSVNPEKFKKITLNYADLMGDEPFEIIGIHDAKSLCEGYNRGIRESAGDFLIFSHDDIEILSPDFLTRLKIHLNNFDVVGLAGTDMVVDGCWLSAGVPYLYGQVADQDEAGYVVSFYDFGNAVHQGKVATNGMQMLDGLFFAMRGSVVRQVLFDEQNFDGFHGYDADFTYSAFLAGFSLAVCTDLAVIHYSNRSFDSAFQYYNQRFVAKHAATIANPQPQVSRPSFQAARCKNKEGVLHCFSPEVQISVYDQFVAMFPALGKTVETLFK